LYAYFIQKYKKILTFIPMKPNNKLNTTNPTKTNYNLSYNAYYPYGMLVPKCNYSNPVYRYGFQGQEKDDEIKGIGTKQKNLLIFA